MNYSQKAAESLRSGEEYPLKLLQNAGLTALGGGAASVGSKALGKLVPAIGALINNYVPENLAVKGLSKIDSRLGKFVQGALEEGYSFDELRNFMGEKIEKTQQPAKKNKNIIEQESPELFQFLNEQIKIGNNPISAAAAAQNDKRFSDLINKLSKKHKTPWSSIIESVFGNGDMAQTNQLNGGQGFAAIGGIGSAISENFYKQGFDILKKGSTILSGVNDPLLQAAKPAFDQGQIKTVEDLKRFSQQYYQSKQQPSQPQSAQAGTGQQALMGILQKINQRLGQ